MPQYFNRIFLYGSLVKIVNIQLTGSWDVVYNSQLKTGRFLTSTTI